MKLIVGELGFGATNELFQEITVGDNSRDGISIRPTLYRHNNPSGDVRVDIRDLNGEIAASSSTVAISSIAPGSDFFHGQIRFSFDFGWRTGEQYRIYLVGLNGYSFSESSYIGWVKDYDLRKYPASYTPNVGMNSSYMMEVWDSRQSREGFENEQDS